MNEKEKKAVESVTRMLAYAPSTEGKLKEKLKAKGYGESEISFALEYVRKKGFLNEKEYLFRFVELAAKSGYGKKRILQKAYEKRFSKSLIDECFAEACEEQDFIEACRTRIRKTKTADPEKLLAALARYGFGYTEAKEAIRKELEEDE